MSEPDEGAGQAPPPTESIPVTARLPEPIEADPLYHQAIRAMQQGQWQEAARAVSILENRYPGSVELQRVENMLELHLSAEEGWSKFARPRRQLFDSPLVRALGIANIVLYLLLGILWLLGKYE